MFKKNDIILLGVVLVISFFLFGWRSIRIKEEGGAADIYVDTQLYKTVPLTEDGEIAVSHENGVNRIEIKNGEVKMLQADCPDGICVLHKAVRAKGETITCLPNKIVIKITGGEENELDAISQ